MRQYTINIIIEDEDDVITLADNDSTKDIRKKYYYHWDDRCYWAKKIDGEIKYSRDDVFNTERQDATHIVAFIK